MANITLQLLFKNYLNSLKSNKEFRDNLNKEATHYFTQDVQALKSQISLVNQKIESEFNKKYAQALEVLQAQGMSNVTFGKIATTLKSKFLDHFTDLKEIGIDTGHVFANLTVASKQKAQTEIFEGFTGTVSEYSQVQLTPKNLEEIGKTIALISAYTGALEELDKIQDRKSLIQFLKKAPVFKQYSRSQNLNTLDDIKNAISSAYQTKAGVRGLGELGDQLLKSSIINLEASTVVDFSRKITATESKVAVTFEIRAVNQFKGQVAQAIKTSFTNILQNIIDKDEFSESINAALQKSISQEFTKEQFLSIFTKASGSKSIEEAVTDIFYDTLSLGKAKNYSANSRRLTDTIKNSVKINPPTIKLKKPNIKSISIKPLEKLVPKSLSSLQNILNSKITAQVRQNMGNGSRKDILNYRTGRFAESVQINNLTQGREGMITAYYTYMKYPYATFSEGGRQQYPRSRDPKALISKSIREIMQEQMITRMRAVLA